MDQTPLVRALRPGEAQRHRRRGEMQNARMKVKRMNGRSVRSSREGGPYLQLELSLRSEVGAISPFVDTFIHLIKRLGWVPGSEEDIETALREGLANAVTHGNQEDPRKRVYVGCRGGTDEVSIV